MIHNFSVENFYSIYDKQELDFTSNKKYNNSSIFFSENTFINNVNCFIGANASGKTNIFKALHFLIWFAQTSFYDLYGDFDALFDSHKLRTNDLTEFNLEFSSGNKLYKYNLKLTKHRIIEETLETKGIKGFSYLYKL